MSRRRYSPLAREAIVILGERGHAADVDTAGKHIKIFWAVGGRKHLLVLARTPSDHRADANARSTLRRLLAQEAQS
jgi:hypothetical protein